MFVRWKKRVLQGDEFRGDALCTHTGPNRCTMRPVAMESYRDEYGTPKHRVLWRPSKTIRSCCAKESVDPLARAEWWSYLWQDIEELETLSVKRGYKYLRPLAAKVDHLVELMVEVVAIPTGADFALYHAWINTAADRQSGEGSIHCYKRRLEEARVAVASQIPGVNGSMTPTQAAETLGVTLPTDGVALKLAFRKAALASHPDKGGSSGDFILVRAAFELLLTTLNGDAL